MASLHVNAVRIPAKEDCWLVINGVKPACGGASYPKAIVDYVDLLNHYDMYAELSLGVGGPRELQGNESSRISRRSPLTGIRAG